jgi:hypothetical protein
MRARSWQSEISACTHIVAQTANVIRLSWWDPANEYLFGHEVHTRAKVCRPEQLPIDKGFGWTVQLCRIQHAVYQVYH